MSNGNETTEKIYYNDNIMRGIVRNVELFKDRNSLELSSKRLKLLSDTTPIARRNSYAIKLEDDPDWSGFLTLLMRPRKYSSRLTVCTASDTPEDEKFNLVVFNYKDNKHDTSVFYDGVTKKLRNQITEFEIKHRRFSVEVLRNIERFPNLNRVIVKNARNFSDDIGEENVDINISDRLTSLELTLDRQWCTEVGKMKRLIGPSLKHFCCYVNPGATKTTWFIEEIMVEMGIHNVQLDSCQLVFPENQMPSNLILAFTQFMTERSQVMEVIVTSGNTRTAAKWTRIVPKVDIELRGEEDNILKLLLDSCSAIFNRAEVVRIANLHESHFHQLAEAMEKCWCIRELHVMNDPQNKIQCPIDLVLLDLPSTVSHLYLENCKLSATSIDILSDRGVSTIQNLHLINNGNCNTVQNFNKLLNGLQQLKVLEMDMRIPHLLFPKLTEHPTLETFIGYTHRVLPKDSLNHLRQHFNHVQLKKIDRQKQQITISKAL